LASAFVTVSIDVFPDVRDQWISMSPSTTVAQRSNTLRLGFSTNVQLSWIDEFDSLIRGTLRYALMRDLATRRWFAD
jgi:hypothetical protein